jgi:hypothetical protein
MTYRFQGLGQDQDDEYDWGKAAEDCINAADVDWSEKSGREEGAESVGACAAEAVCAYFTAGASTQGPWAGLCGTVGGEVAKALVDTWNALFGNEEEWEEYRRRKAEVAAHFASMGAADLFDTSYKALFSDAAARLVTYAHTYLPALRAIELGSMPCSKQRIDAGERMTPGGPVVLKEAIDFYVCQRDHGAAALLGRYGAAIRKVDRVVDGSVRKVVEPASVLAQGMTYCQRGTTGERTACIYSYLEAAAGLGSKPSWIEQLGQAEAQAKAQLIAEATAFKIGNMARYEEGMKKMSEWRESFERDRAAHRRRALMGAAVGAAGLGAALWIWRSR